MTSTAQESTLVPQIGRYHVIAELARGGMGDVYLAASQGPGGFNKLHAVKELKPSLCGDETYVTMFLEEARLAARLIHPNIVQTNEVGSDDGRHFIVMEFLDGRSLHRIGKRLKERLPTNAHLHVIADALLGLHHAHELRGFDGQMLGIVHRDVSPLNVFVTFNGQTKVIDFGIAKSVHSALDTRTGILKGRVAYMSPEQANGSKVDRRADVYSAGVMIWEAAAGRRLWPRMTEAEILTRVVREPAPSLRSVQPRAPDELNAICARAMAQRRDDRYTSAADLFGDLERYLGRSGDAMSMRDIGALVGQAFADERDKMNRAIEETLARVARAPRSGSMPKGQNQLGTRTSDPVDDASLVTTRRLLTPSGSFGPSSAHSQSAPATAASLGNTLAATEAPLRTKRAAVGPIAIAALLLGGLLFAASWHRARAPSWVAPTAGKEASSESAPSRESPNTAQGASAVPKAAEIGGDPSAVIPDDLAGSVRDATPHAAARHPPPPADQSLHKANCQPPYFVDAHTGIKRWRLECL